jgi:hypothetical protein
VSDDVNSAYRVINELLANAFLRRSSAINAAKYGDWSEISNAEMAALRYLRENATSETCVRASIYDLVFPDTKAPK